ncbi:MAG: Uma2 family endonuclease [Candidatus Solibacter usitatus]|nr:Uma2 family endonuclease [Candidatus Solibacter usitatus]
MAAVVSAVEHKVVLEGVSWETYQRLLAEHENENGARFSYDEGTLEIMVLSARHEHPNRILALLVELVAAELDIEIFQLGSTTFQRPELLRGFEPDSAFYIAHAPEFGGRDVNPTLAPPPDLLIEVDVTSSSLLRFPIFAAFGVPEVWRYDGTRVAIFRLEGGQYGEVESSGALPPVTAALATRFLDDRRRLGSTKWLRRVREWARAQRA